MVSCIPRNPSKQRGFSLLELVVVVCIIAIMMAVAYQRFERLSEEAERASFYGVINTLQAQLNLQVADWYINSTNIERRDLEMLNPVEWLERPPQNYGGVVNSEQLTELLSARWYYVKDKGQLVYKVKRIAHLKNKAGNDLLSFRLTVSYQDPLANTGIVQAAVLKVINTFTWDVVDP